MYQIKYQQNTIRLMKITRVKMNGTLLLHEKVLIDKKKHIIVKIVHYLLRSKSKTELKNQHNE